MSATRVFVARLAGCAVFDPNGERVGKARDVLVVYRKNDPPRVVGLIVEIPGKRRVFVSIGRVTSISGGQIITTGLINLRRFEQRGGEVRVIAEMLGRRVAFNDGSGVATIEDVAIEEQEPGADQLLAGRRAAVPVDVDIDGALLELEMRRAGDEVEELDGRVARDEEVPVDALEEARSALARVRAAQQREQRMPVEHAPE